ncbi:phosphohistidine phosphatase SixA [Stutzerimonas zhaodongensis]|uniref:Phosphohistidine phosphatase SixA n=1 Tax=Stutzerimonas zhaodongensis TaxID=1176257 RepID=A0A3M2HWT9_9GAMM|nr:phosphohistidine phosphatase SixA [Stutzerimonas zhaodongensis]MCQ2029909.1 phosphohistidine phosphatase SixA [Stutzerimonas zhaodongensis]MCQ4314576.1 phosphohistidine phosphatase SixA [Stutzerimonas zhaodongensis]RMH92090.1 phosphohistidine phosphatase SixA [Stutzerimonas zhaodongensis]
MKLWLLRHGEAEPKARTDAERNLTENGRMEVQSAAAHLQDQPLQAILVSPYQRAQQTAEIVRQVLGFSGPVETVPWLTPESDPGDAMLYLDRRSEQRLLLVTHQPFVGVLGGWLVNGHRDTPIPMATASLAELEGEYIATGLMRLTALRHPS